MRKPRPRSRAGLRQQNGRQINYLWYASGPPGRADNGAVVASGLYFVRIDQNGAARSKKMVLLK